MKNLPIPKKSIKLFLAEEDGKMTKENLLKVGGLLTAAGLATITQSMKTEAHDAGSIWCSGHRQGTETPKNHHQHDVALKDYDHTNSFTFGLNSNGNNRFAMYSSHSNDLPTLNDATDHNQHCSHGSHCNCSGWS